jgi:hypothetical protein
MMSFLAFANGVRRGRNGQMQPGVLALRRTLQATTWSYCRMKVEIAEFPLVLLSIDVDIARPPPEAYNECYRKLDPVKCTTLAASRKWVRNVWPVQARLARLLARSIGLARQLGQ